jgi:hypothetical protein
MSIGVMKDPKLKLRNLHDWGKELCHLTYLTDMEEMILLHIVYTHTPPADSCFVIGSQKLVFCRRRKCPFDTLAVTFVRWYLVAFSCVDGWVCMPELVGQGSEQTEHEHTHLHHLTLPDTQEMFREDLYCRQDCRVWEYIRKLNPGGKGIRYWSRRGGTKTSSKEVKRSYFDHRSKESTLGNWTESQGHSEQESFHNQKFNQNIER